MLFIMEKKKHTMTDERIRDQYAGADIDAADDNKVDAAMVEAETKALNDNPRNQAIIDD